ncbi:MAG: DUF481 domain-containing protein [Rubrivivax sp.]
MMHRPDARPLPISLLGLALLAALPAARADDKTDGLWRGNGTAAFSYTSGNTSSRALLLSVDAVRATTADKITLGINSNYGRSRQNGIDETTSNKWSAAGQYDFNLSPRLYAFGKLGLEGDKLADLDLRSMLAAGLGYKLISTPETSFDLLAGAAYTTDRYGDPQTIAGKTDTRFSRSSLMLGEASSHQLSSTVSFKQRLELYPGLSGDKAKLAKFSAGLGVAMSSTMQLTVGLTDNYNSRPPAGQKKNDVGVFTGVNVKFGAN